MSPDNFHIREASPSDADAIVAVTNAAFGFETFIAGPRTDSQHLAEQMQTGKFLVAHDAKNRILASIYIELRGERGYFGMLAVDHARQGQGLGRALIDAAENFCRDRGCKAMDIAALSQRPELLPIYRHLGYRETGTEEFHPRTPLKPGIECHIIVMTKDLL